MIFSSESSVLLDCGEGTLTQLKHHYGDAVDDVIKRIKCIFISHSHEDHILVMILFTLLSRVVAPSCIHTKTVLFLMISDVFSRFSLLQPLLVRLNWARSI